MTDIQRISDKIKEKSKLNVDLEKIISMDHPEANNLRRMLLCTLRNVVQNHLILTPEDTTRIITNLQEGGNIIDNLAHFIYARFLHRGTPIDSTTNFDTFVDNDIRYIRELLDQIPIYRTNEDIMASSVLSLRENQYSKVISDEVSNLNKYLDIPTITRKLLIQNARDMNTLFSGSNIFDTTNPPPPPHPGGPAVFNWDIEISSRLDALDNLSNRQETVNKARTFINQIQTKIDTWPPPPAKQDFSAEIAGLNPLLGILGLPALNTTPGFFEPPAAVDPANKANCQNNLNSISLPNCNKDNIEREIACRMQDLQTRFAFDDIPHLSINAEQQERLSNFYISWRKDISQIENIKAVMDDPNGSDFERCTKITESMKDVYNILKNIPDFENKDKLNSSLVNIEQIQSKSIDENQKEVLKQFGVIENLFKELDTYSNDNKKKKEIKEKLVQERKALREKMNKFGSTDSKLIIKKYKEQMDERNQSYMYRFFDPRSSDFTGGRTALSNDEEQSLCNLLDNHPEYFMPLNSEVEESDIDRATEIAVHRFATALSIRHPDLSQDKINTLAQRQVRYNISFSNYMDIHKDFTSSNLIPRGTSFVLRLFQNKWRAKFSENESKALNALSNIFGSVVNIPDKILKTGARVGTKIIKSSSNLINKPFEMANSASDGILNMLGIQDENTKKHIKLAGKVAGTLLMPAVGLTLFGGKFLVNKVSEKSEKIDQILEKSSNGLIFTACQGLRNSIADILPETIQKHFDFENTDTKGASLLAWYLLGTVYWALQRGIYGGGSKLLYHTADWASGSKLTTLDQDMIAMRKILPKFLEVQSDQKEFMKKIVSVYNDLPSWVQKSPSLVPSYISKYLNKYDNIIQPDKSPVKQEDNKAKEPEKKDKDDKPEDST